EVHLRLGPEGEMLLPARHQRLLEEAADRLAADEAKEARPFGQRQDAFRIWRAQPLEVERQFGRVEIVTRLAGFDPRSRAGRRLDLQLRHRAAMLQPQPAVVAPDAFLDRRLAPERRAPQS